MSRDVVVPDALREVVLVALLAEIRRRRVSDGDSRIRPEVLALIEALRYGGTQPEEPTSASGSVHADSGTVWLTTPEVAAAMKCSERWAREIAHRIGARTGRQWLIERETFEQWRHSA